MTFSKIARIVSTLIFVTIISSASAENKKSAKTYDWNRVMDAITQVESGGDVNARNGNCVGPMQIAPITVEDCNIILKKWGEKRRYTLSDRYNVQKSREMFIIIQKHYNPSNDVERGIRLWNGGVRFKMKSTQRYYNKVMAEMAKK